MGGAGSGNHYHWWRGNKKTVVEDCLRLDANRWARDGIKAGVCISGSWQWTYHSGRVCSITYEVNTLDVDWPELRLSYSRTRQERTETLAYAVGLTTTAQRFGGLRWWFTCPLLRGGVCCGRRVGKLYLPPGGVHFGCRQCHELTYTSCQESHKDNGLARLLARNMGADLHDVKWMMRRLGKGP